jgi:hypothetical protein
MANLELFYTKYLVNVDAKFDKNVIYDFNIDNIMNAYNLIYVTFNILLKYIQSSLNNNEYIVLNESIKFEYNENNY